MGGALAGADGGVDGSPVAGGVSVFSGEVEGVVGGDGHLGASVEGSGGDVAVGSAGEGVVLPVVGVAEEELTAEVGWVEGEDFSEGFAGGFG